MFCAPYICMQGSVVQMSIRRPETGSRIVAAGCILPMPTGNVEGDAGYGMRHRAAKALAAECDAMVIVVSEETGGISIAYRNSLRRKLSIKELDAEIKRHWAELFHEETVAAEKAAAED